MCRLLLPPPKRHVDLHAGGGDIDVNRTTTEEVTRLLSLSSRSTISCCRSRHTTDLCVAICRVFGRYDQGVQWHLTHYHPVVVRRRRCPSSSSQIFRTVLWCTDRHKVSRGFQSVRRRRHRNRRRPPSPSSSQGFRIILWCTDHHELTWDIREVLLQAQAW